VPEIDVTPGLFVAVLATLVVLYKAGEWVLARTRKLGRFLDSWEGFEGSDGKHVPGILERLARVEDTAVAAASAAAAANERTEVLSGQVAEVDRKVDALTVAGQDLAAEQTLLKATLDGLASHTDVPGTDTDGTP
jgi:hypothetical protein